MRNENIGKIFLYLSDTLNISNSDTQEIVQSYNAVGSYLGNLEEHLDISIYPQGSLSLGTIIKPLATDRNGEYDIDLVCQINNGSTLVATSIKNIIGDRLKESSLYLKKLDQEGKRCWTLNYAKYHMDVLPCIPYVENPLESKIKLTEKLEDGNYYFSFGNPKGFRKWFINEMQTIFEESRKSFSVKNNISIEEVELYQVRTPLQRTIQILKRHRDIAFEGKDNRPNSIIITTLAAKAYNGESDLYTALINIINNMTNYIEEDINGVYKIYNPVDSSENFADRWEKNPEKKDAFFSWLKKAKFDIIENPLNFIEGLDSLKENLSKSFGTEVTEKSFELYGERISEQKDKGPLGLTSEGYVTTDKSETTKEIPDHTFYGGE